jgi:phosphatase NudJ
MHHERWKPAVTVAAVIADGGRYLLVQEHTREGLRLNNPAGHLDPGESPFEAVVRECLEETKRMFVPDALVGFYLWRFTRSDPQEDVTFLRVAYAGTVGEELPGRAFDEGIVRTLWLTPDEIRARQAEHRSPLVMRCIDDHLAGRRLPLEAIQVDGSLRDPPHLGTGAQSP